MNHEFCNLLQLWVDSFPSWDTTVIAGDSTLFSKALRLNADTVYVKLGDSSKPIIVLNPTALAFGYDTTIQKTGDTTNTKTTKRIKPYLSWTGDYRNHPVQGVSWYGASLFCWLKTKKENLDQCIDTTGLLFNLTDLSKSGYRLPTEAEWEWTARDTNSGDNAYYPTGSSISPYRARIGAQSAAKTGSFSANSRGIYDLTGNLWEWCIDSYSAVFYTSPSATSPNPVNAPSGVTQRVIRGGSFNDSDAKTFRTARRSKMLPLYMGEDAGFRIVRR
jgi:formylglycine-generating enzyme required for sulfatase activity